MEIVIVLIVIFVIGFLVVGGTLVMAFKEHMKTTPRSVINHNDRLTKFVYKIPMKKEEITEALRSVKDTSEIRCEVDPAVSQLVFDGINGRRKYVYAVREEKGSCYFYIKELYTPLQGNVEYKINSFMIANLGAELVPFNEKDFELD